MCEEKCDKSCMSFQQPWLTGLALIFVQAVVKWKDRDFMLQKEIAKKERKKEKKKCFLRITTFYQVVWPSSFAAIEEYKKILDLLDQESVSGESSGRFSL